MPVWLSNRTPNAVGPVLLVASKPKARLAAADALFVGPKLRMPPVVWSPAVAPNCTVAFAKPYHPGMVLDNPRPPPPVASTGKAKSNGSLME